MDKPTPGPNDRVNYVVMYRREVIGQLGDVTWNELRLASLLR